MPTVQVSGAEIWVNYSLGERIFGFFPKRHRVSLRDVLGASARDRAHLPRRVIRRLGLGLPRTKLGWFGPLGERRSPWCIHRAEEVLVIELRPSARWSWMVLEVSEPEAVAAAINRMRTR